MTVYPEDPDAPAVVLTDYGKVRFDYRNPKGLGLQFERHVRIKILKKSGLQYGDFEIPLYKKGEKIGGSIKGVTYNVENGKIEETKLDKDQVFTQEMNDYYDVVKFSMPNVKEGSIVEFKYTVISEYILTLVAWEFQREIPTRWSEFRAQIPEFFHYKTHMSGYLPITLMNTTQLTDVNQIRITNHQWAVEKAPALKEEKFITTMDDFTSKIEFELQVINIPGRVYEEVSHTWEKLNADLNNDANFGKQIGKGKYLSETVAKVTAPAKTHEEKAALITQFVRQNIKYNGKRRVFTSKSLKKVLEEKEGNSAEINLLMVSMLQEAGLQANPVILSTRDHGRVNYTPLIQDFNYVIAHVKFEKGELLLDGTDPGLPYNMLPFQCLNQQGRIISPHFTSWVSLSNDEKIKETVSGTFKLNADGSLKGQLKFIENGYIARETREKIRKDGEEKYLEAIRGEHGDWAINSYKNNNFDNVNQDLEEFFELDLTSLATPAAGKIYLQPMLVGAEKENPFKLEKREYPVDFGCPIEEMYMFSIEIPEGYVVEELPQTAAFALPNKGGMFRYNITSLDNKITLMSTLKIEKPLFVGDEYAIIKQFYDLIVAKQAEQVVLKKVK